LDLGIRFLRSGQLLQLDLEIQFLRLGQLLQLDLEILHFLVVR
jgi:hypothetical protein